MVNHCNEVFTSLLSIWIFFGKKRRKRKLWIIQEIIFDQRWDLKKKRCKIEGGNDYLEIERKIRTEMKIAKETMIEYQEVGAWLRKTNSKKAYRLVNVMSTEKQDNSITIRDKTGMCLRAAHEPLNGWTEVCWDLYNMRLKRTQLYLTVVDWSKIPNEEHHLFLREEVETAVKTLKKGRSINIPDKKETHTVKLFNFSERLPVL